MFGAPFLFASISRAKAERLVKGKPPQKNTSIEFRHEFVNYTLANLDGKFYLVKGLLHEA